MLITAGGIFFAFAVAVWLVTWIIQGGAWGLVVLVRLVLVMLRLVKMVLFALIWAVWWVVAPQAAERALNRAKETLQ